MVYMSSTWLGVTQQYCRKVRWWCWTTATSPPGSRKQTAAPDSRVRALGLTAGPDCLLLVIMLLQAIVSQGSLDGVLRKHGAVKFNRWQTELFGNVSVLYHQRFVHRFALHPLGGQGAGGYGRTAAESFEPGIHNLPLVIHLNLSKQVRRVLFKCQRDLVWDTKYSC